MPRPLVASFVAAVALGLARDAHAIRPFVTDDARVVGRGHAQLETWLQLDEDFAQHWALPALGPTDWLELTTGVVHGLRGGEGDAYGLAGPLLQAKALLRPTVPGELPGVAVAAGSLLPAGVGFLDPAAGGAFGYLAATQSFLPDDAFLIHVNLGTAYRAEDEGRWEMTAGLGTQVHVAGGLYALGEVFYGDAYTGARDVATQVGARWSFGEQVQVDLSGGTGLAGEDRRPAWISAGVRLVSSKLF